MNSYSRHSIGDFDIHGGSDKGGVQSRREISIIVINRADAMDRMEFQEKQLNKLGLSFFRLEAYTPSTIPKSIKESYWRRWRRPLEPDECAQFLSHSLAWDWVNNNGPALIVEDDAILTNSLPEILQNLENVEGMDHLTLEVRGRRKLVGKSSTPIGHGIAGHRLYLDRIGSAAYVLWPSGAKVLIKRAKKSAASTDGMAQWSRGMRSYQADPACAVQLDMAEAYGLTPPLIVDQAIKQTRVRIGTPIQRLRFILAQTHKVLRLLRYGLVSERRKIPLKPEYFDV